ncbi:MAG: hypothetical protein GF311_28630 [Candidatus Lokiarchaeota archaeon]|nr:hypothetical protein [Candidatus Lokiarchaeota archaeon]
MLYTIPRKSLARALVRKQVDRLFEKALQQPEITAWVAANDEVALWALDLLAEKGVRVPKEISVMGFDDRTEALQERLTSYNFNFRAIIPAMIDFVLRKERSLAHRMRKPLEIEGTIIERQTVCSRAYAST